MHVRGNLALLILSSALLLTAREQDAWLERVGPILLPAEKKAYLALGSQAERDGFAEAFWAGKRVTQDEYFARLAEADQRFGSGRTGSGANTDQGRMHLSFGPPKAVHRVPSSRIFYETEIWYYDSLPQTGYSSRLQFLFFRPRNLGDFKLYSPSTHTIRALLLPQSTTRGMFPINDLVTATDVRNRLHVPPTEDEVVEAALGVAKGITGVGNEEILSRALSPGQMLRRETKELVRSAFFVGAVPESRVLQYVVDGVQVVDVQLRAMAARSMAVTIDHRHGRIERSELPLHFPEPKLVKLTQRFFLPPGIYLLTLEVDGAPSRLPFSVSATETGKIQGEALPEVDGETLLSLTPDPRSTMAREAQRRAAGIVAAGAAVR